jgi:NitT/TauT family transport system substrate-binding protein
MKTSVIVATIALIVIVVGAVGVYMSGILTPPATIRVGYLQGDLHQLSLQVAIAEGYFTSRGLNVTLYQYPNGPTLMQHFSAGELDFAYVGVPPALQERASAIVNPNATQLPIVIGSANLEGSAIVVDTTKIPNVAALNGSHIGTPGVGTIQDVLLDIYSTEHHIIINKFPSTNAQLVTQFQADLFDGYIAWEPTPSLGVLQANGTVLLTSKDILPNHQCCVVVVSDKYFAKHPDVVTKFVEAHNAAMDFINNNPTVAKQVGVNYTGLSADVINIAFNDVTYNKTVNVDSIRTFLVAKILLGQITTVNASEVDSFMSGFISSEYVH